MDGQTDGQTDRRTDRASKKFEVPQLKRKRKKRNWEIDDGR